MGEPLVGERAVQIAEVHEAGGAGRYAGDLCALRKAARRVKAFVILGSLVLVRKYQLSKTFKAHIQTSFYLYVICFSYVRTQKIFPEAFAPAVGASRSPKRTDTVSGVSVR